MDLAAFGHAEVSFERVLDALAAVRSTAHIPLFQVALEEVGPQRRSILGGEPDQTRFDLHLTVGPRFDAQRQPAGLKAELIYAVTFSTR